MVRRRKRWPVGGGGRRFFDPGPGKRAEARHYYNPGFRFEPGISGSAYSIPGSGGFFMARTNYGVF